MTAEGEERPFNVNYDNANKLISFSAKEHQHVGVITYGQALIGRRTAHSFVPELELDLPDDRVPIREYAQQVSDFYLQQWNKHMPSPEKYPGADMSFAVAGYDPNKPYGRVFVFSVPNSPNPIEQNEDEFGLTWGGEIQIVHRLIKGVDPQLSTVLKDSSKLDDNDIQRITKEVRNNLSYVFPYEILPLQDCVDLAILLIRTTIDFQGLALGVRGVGGMIETATITRTNGLEFVQRKRIEGERREP